MDKRLAPTICSLACGGLDCPRPYLPSGTLPDLLTLSFLSLVQVTQDWCGLASAATVLNALPVPKPEVYAFDG